MNTPFVSPEEEASDDFSRLLKESLGPGSLKKLPLDLRDEVIQTVAAAPIYHRTNLRLLSGPVVIALPVASVLIWVAILVSRMLSQGMSKLQVGRAGVWVEQWGEGFLSLSLGMQSLVILLPLLLLLPFFLQCREEC